MTEREELRAVLREVARIEAVAAAVDKDTPGDAAARLLDDTPAGPPPGWWAAAFAGARRVDRPWGPLWRLTRHAFYETAPTPFVGAVLADGPVVSFHPGPRPDLHPLVARRAVDRVFAARGWRLPDDLGRPDAWCALWDLALATDALACPDPPPPGDLLVAHPAGATVTIALTPGRLTVRAVSSP